MSTQSPARAVGQLILQQGSVSEFYIYLAGTGFLHCDVRFSKPYTMGQQASSSGKVLAASCCCDLSLMPGTHVVGEENQSVHTVLEPPPCVHISTHTPKLINVTRQD